MTSLNSLSPLDEAILDNVARFRLASSGQLRRLHYEGRPEPITDGSAKTMCARNLKRLVKWRELRRVPRAMGGHASGSSEYIYMLPASEAERAPLHTLLITELYVLLVEAQRAGLIDEFEYLPEDEGYVQYGNTQLRPDAKLKFTLPGDPRWRHYFIEVDRGRTRSGEYRTYLKKKMNGYLSADSQKSAALFPTVVLTALSQARIRFILESARQTRDRTLFECVLFDDVVQFLIGG